MPSASSTVSSETSACSALGRPRSHHEWPPGPRTREPRAHRADGVDADLVEAVALERDRHLGPQLAAGVERAAEVAEALLADGEHDRERPRQLGRERLDDVHGDGDGRRVVADRRRRAASRRRLVHAQVDVGGEHRVDVREQRQRRRPVAEAPDEVAGRVARARARRRREPLLEPREARLLGAGRRGRLREALRGRRRAGRARSAQRQPVRSASRRRRRAGRRIGQRRLSASASPAATSATAASRSAARSSAEVPSASIRAASRSTGSRFVTYSCEQRRVHVAARRRARRGRRAQRERLDRLRALAGARALDRGARRRGTRRARRCRRRGRTGSSSRPRCAATGSGCASPSR